MNTQIESTKITKEDMIKKHAIFMEQQKEFEEYATAYALSNCPFNLGQEVECIYTYRGKKMIVDDIGYKVSRVYKNGFTKEVEWVVYGRLLKKDGSVSLKTSSVSELELKQKQDIARNVCRNGA